MNFFNPFNQILFPDRNKEYYAVVIKESNRVINILDSEYDLSFFDINKVIIKKTDLKTLFIHNLVHDLKMSKTEAIIWAYGYFERINIDFVLKHFNCKCLNDLKKIYNDDPALFKFKISKLLNFNMEDFDKEFKLKDLNEN